MKCFELSSVSFGYEKNNTILDNINLSFTKGVSTAICGKNGSGKSTLIKLLGGILSPDAGTICLYGKKTSHYKRKIFYKHIAYVPQQHNVDIPLNVEEVILTGRHPYDNFMQSDKTIDLEVLESTIKKTGLEKYRDKLFNNLSGGEKQKVLIARAICQTEDIILLDEPTASLDIANKVEIFDLLKKLTDAGTTIITVSHDINEVYANSNEVVLVKDKNIISGLTENVFTTENLISLYGTKINHSEEGTRKFFYY